jgi:hypothetical protein
MEPSVPVDSVKNGDLIASETKTDEDGSRALSFWLEKYEYRYALKSSVVMDLYWCWAMYARKNGSNTSAPPS